ncbi:MAG: homogentisate phytyltransferase [Cyanobacteriota bacterium]|nr:homogentisate phytyltransferase [Cyanobacteriota bacterium]
MAESSQKNLTISQVNLIQKYIPWLYSFWKFSRPHTIIGTSLSVLGLTLVAWSDNIQNISNDRSFITTVLVSVIVSWLACLCGNIYIVGLNQLEDVEIDRINKPHLPIASGEYSKFQAKAIIITTGLLALLFATVQGKFLLATVGVSLAIGTAYSLPPIRLKRFPFWAALCIFTVRGVIVNLGLYLHLSWVLSNHTIEGIPSLTPSVLILTLFILVFTFAIAIFKDIPDIEGDRQYNITTFTIRLGTVAVFNLARWVLTGCYLGMIVAVILLQGWVNPILLVSSHLILLSLMWWQSTKVDLGKKEAIADFYQFIWKLFFLEYLIFPLTCLLQ